MLMGPDPIRGCRFYAECSATLEGPARKSRAVAWHRACSIECDGRSTRGGTRAETIRTHRSVRGHVRGRGHRAVARTDAGYDAGTAHWPDPGHPAAGSRSGV